jgi:cytosine/adenosine deaminase-related metal-dependent hydrolase
VNVRLLSAPWVLPIAAPPIRDGAVTVDERGRVLAVGRRADLRGAAPEERARGVLMPALLNAHTHLELCHLAGAVPGGDGLVPWTGRVMARPQAAPELVREAARAGVRALHAAGVAAVGDVGNSLAALAALGETPLRGLFFHEVLGSRATAPGGALADLARERAALAAWPDRITYVPAPHAPYSASSRLLREVFAAAAATGHPTTIHLAEDADEIALLLDGGGRWPAVLERLGVPLGSRTPRQRPVAYLASLGAFAAPAPPLLVHMVHADAEDRALARRHGASVVLCPRSNLHIGGRLPDVPALLADGIPLALGTDSLASSPSLSPWGEIAALAERFPALPPDTWLRAATAGGASALALPALGALAPGRCPGVIDVAVGDESAPLPALVRDPAPSVTWMAAA